MPSFAPTQQSEPPISVAEAQRRVLDAVVPVATELVALDDTLGRVLREDVVAEWDVPGADNSAMDGYAVRAEDLAGATGESPVRLRVIDDVPAGSVSKVRVGNGEAARIMTGAPVPDGADAVVQVEITDGGSEYVMILRSLKSGANIRRRGEDIAAGQTVLRAGTLVGSGEIGVLATVGRRVVVVSRCPSVAILSTGSELVEPGDRPGPGQVTNSNAHALAALVAECGAEPRVMQKVPDNLNGTIESLREALACDVVLTSGGVSVGAYDFVKDAACTLGAETKFWRVAMKPGKPVLFATLDGRLVFGLPGNPVSSMVGFHLFVAPALRTMTGQTEGLLPPVVKTRAVEAMRSTGERPTYLRVRVHVSGGELVSHSMKAQGSGITTSMIAANGLALVPEGVTRVEAGELVDTVLIGRIESD